MKMLSIGDVINYLHHDRNIYRATVKEINGDNCVLALHDLDDVRVNVTLGWVWNCKRK